MYYFYDTNALLTLGEKILENEKFFISSVSLQELENIKTNRNKTDDIKYQARQAVRILTDHSEKYEVITYTPGLLDKAIVEDTPDNKICACAAWLSKTEKIRFVTSDLCCAVIAKHIFNLDVEINSESDLAANKYTGFIERTMTEEEMAAFYSHPNENWYDLLVNQYLIIKNTDGEVVDKLKWSGRDYQPVKVGSLKSDQFGAVKPYNGDVYQQCALNSMVTNQVTMIKGHAGTGKSYLALGVLFHLLEKHKIDKVILLTNPVATTASAKLGYLPGSQTEKLLDASIGHMLGSKLGDKIIVERLIADGKLMLLPMCDIRGFDTSGMNAGVYITEAQNLDINLMKLALQRIGEDSICIIDGDYDAQVDMSIYSGYNNGMRRMSEVFRGQDFYGEVELQNIYRSRIAAIADQM